MISLVVATLIGVPGGPKPGLKFNGVDYVHRYSKDNLNEYTPKAQTNLDKWTDMVTINDYPSVKSGEELARNANSVLDTYKSQKGMVVRTNSVPRTDKKEAEHLIVVMFARPDFIETAFARFVIMEGKGHSVVYSHRVYGKKAGDPMSKWLKANGEICEKALMGMATFPQR